MIGTTAIGSAPLASVGDDDAPAESRANIIIPMAVVSSVGHAISGAAVIAPMPAVSARGGHFGRIVIPMPTVYAAGAWRGGITVPMPVVRATGNPGRNIVDITLPMMLVAAQAGHNAAVTIPMPVVAATMTNVGWAQAAVTMPMAVVAASGVTSARGTADIYIPMPTVKAQAGHNAAIVIPMPTVAASIAGGSYGRGAITMPMMTVQAGALTQGMGAVTVPMPTVKAQGGHNGSIIIPMAQVVAIGGAQVTVTYEAYSINLAHVGLGPRQAAVDEVTRYTNYPFTDIVRLGNDYYGVGTNGLFKLGGTTDYDPAAPLVPKAIPWSWRTALTDFDSPMRKAPVSAYFAGRFAPEADVTIYVGETGSVSYAYKTPRGIGAQNYRQKFGRGLRDRYYALGAEGAATLSLDMIEFDINTLTRRI